MHVFPQRCDPLLDSCMRNAQTLLGSVMRYINGGKEMLEKHTHKKHFWNPSRLFVHEAIAWEQLRHC